MEGFKTIAERRMRARRMKRVHKSGDDPIPCAQVRRAFAAAIQDQKLMPDQDRFGDHIVEPAGLRQPNHSDDQMQQKNEEVAHPTILTRPANPLIFAPTLEFAMDILSLTFGSQHPA